MPEWNSKTPKTRHENIMGFSIRGQLCWRCAKACGGCSWSKDFTPVPGWTAEPFNVYNHRGEIESFRIYECPEFVDDVKGRRNR